MSESRDASSSSASRPSRPSATTKSLDSLTASMNRALAGARAPELAAAHQERLRREPSDPADRRAAARGAAVAARRRTNFLLGTLHGLRRGTGGSGRAAGAEGSTA